MTIKELKEKIKDLPNNMEIFIHQTNDDYPNSLAITLEVKTLIIFDENDSESSYEEECLILSDE